MSNLTIATTEQIYWLPRWELKCRLYKIASCKCLFITSIDNNDTNKTFNFVLLLKFEPQLAHLWPPHCLYYCFDCFILVRFIMLNIRYIHTTYFSIWTQIVSHSLHKLSVSDPYSTKLNGDKLGFKYQEWIEEEEAFLCHKYITVQWN